MPNIPGTVIAAKVTTGNTANTFPVADQNELQGGHHSVQSISDRDLITTERRVEGMTCFVADTKQTFQLLNGTTNGDWVDQATATADQLYKTTVLAWTGTATANVALSVAGAGTDLAYIALQQAWYGTDAAARVAYPALVTSWVGTATANVALQVASTGTLGVAAAIDLANKALVVAEGGTLLSQMQDVNIPAPTNAQVLSWNGSKWVAGDAPSTTAPSAFTYYLDDTPSGTAGYSTLLSQPSGIPEVTDVVTVSAATSPVYDDSYLSAELQRTLIDSGVWEFNIYASVSSASGTVITDIYKRSIGGVETYLFSGTSAPVTSLTPQLLTSILAEPQFPASLQDKLLARFWYSTSSATPVNITIYHNGTAHYSHFHTPLRTAHNDLAGLQGGQPEERYHATADQHDALVGTDGHPSAADPFVTSTDPRLAQAQFAYALSQTGTNQAAAGIDLANKALVLAEAGTATADVALSVAGFKGTFSLYMASFRNGPPDTRVTVINGVVTGQTPSIYVWEDFELYPAGTLPPLTQGSAFAGQGTITSSVAGGLVAEDQITYGTGTLYSATNTAGTIFVNQGTGWASNGTINAIYWGITGTDSFEDYSFGTFGTNSSTGFITAPSPINQGIGWAGTATVIAY